MVREQSQSGLVGTGGGAEGGPAQGQRTGAGREGAGSLQGLGPGTAEPGSSVPGQPFVLGTRASCDPGVPGPPVPPPLRLALDSALRRALVTQPSTANVSGRGRRAGYGRSPSLEARAQAGARGAQLERDCGPSSLSRHPPRQPGVCALSACRTCARGARPWPRCARPRRPAGPWRGVAHRAPAFQRHVLPEQQLQLVQEAHGGAAPRPPPRRGQLLCAPRRPGRPPRRSASPARGRGLSARDRFRAGSAPAARRQPLAPASRPRRPHLKAPR